MNDKYPIKSIWKDISSFDLKSKTYKFYNRVNTPEKWEYVGRFETWMEPPNDINSSEDTPYDKAHKELGDLLIKVLKENYGKTS